MKCTHPKSEVCEGRASIICCYKLEGKHHPRVELCCDSYVTNNYQGGKIDTIVVWYVAKQLNRHRWLVKWWMKRMRKAFADSLGRCDIAESFIAREEYGKLRKSI